MKRIVVVSDLHCGHVGGLTPPYKMLNEEDTPKLARLQRAMWRHYRAMIAAHGKPDALLVNGDCIDGRGERSQSSELLATCANRLQQAEMAFKCLSPWQAKEIYMSYGTGYHVGSCEPFEDLIADKLRATGASVYISNHEFIEAEGRTISLKHHPASGGNMVHTRKAGAVDRYHNVNWHLQEEAPLADIFLRSHLHWYGHCGGADWVGIQTPALQAFSKYGANRCHGTIDWGIIELTINKGEVTWTPIIKRLLKGSAVPRKLS